MINDKKSFFKWLKDEKALYKKDNIIYAEKVFFANSVVNWCLCEKNKGAMDMKQIENCVLTLRQFIKGKFDLCWENGVIIIRKKVK
jgi:hypothetical protein